MKREELPGQDGIDNIYYNKYICVDIIMDVPGEGPRRATVRRRVEDLDGTKVVTYHRNTLMDTQE